MRTIVQSVSFKYGGLMFVVDREEIPWWIWRTHIGNGTHLSFPYSRFKSMEQFKREAEAVCLSV